MDNYIPGQIVYCIVRNPHVQGVAAVQQAAVVNDPYSPGQLALFMYETYYPLDDTVAVYASEQEAEFEYQAVFGINGVDEFYG